MDLQKYWFLFALAGSLTYGLEAVLMQYVSPTIHKDLKLILLWIACFCVVLGIIAIPPLVYSYKTNKNLREKMEKNFDHRLAILIGFLSINAGCWHSISLNSGGAYAQQLIKLNILVVMAYGYFFTKEKLNLEIVVGILVSIIGGATLIHGKSKISKNIL